MEMTLESAALCVFPPQAFAGKAMPWDPSACDEADRREALARGAMAMREMEALGLSCGVFGSALRPGDFFDNSDVDLAAWLPGGAPIEPPLALAARAACHRLMGEVPFDLVLLPCSNAAFGERILTRWARPAEDAILASQGLPMIAPALFGPADVAFIDRDRIAIARRAAGRMAAAAALPELGARAAMSLCACMQTVVRVAEKCAKDVLREFAGARPTRGGGRPLYPLMAYPCQALGGAPLASELAVALYLQCSRMLQAPAAPAPGWASSMALAATLFCERMGSDIEPALLAMESRPERRHG